MAQNNPWPELALRGRVDALECNFILQAAEGYSYAQVNLGRALMDSRGTELDFEETTSAWQWTIAILIAIEYI